MKNLKTYNQIFEQDKSLYDKLESNPHILTKDMFDKDINFADLLKDYIMDYNMIVININICIVKQINLLYYMLL